MARGFEGTRVPRRDSNNVNEEKTESPAPAEGEEQQNQTCHFHDGGEPGMMLINNRKTGKGICVDCVMSAVHDIANTAQELGRRNAFAAKALTQSLAPEPPPEPEETPAEQPSE